MTPSSLGWTAWIWVGGEGGREGKGECTEEWTLFCWSLIVEHGMRVWWIWDSSCSVRSVGREGGRAGRERGHGRLGRAETRSHGEKDGE